ncbi:PREDICTED: set1/Ash2 histone methyltransferase complex subunit ASH2 isoform X1 [Nicrophorus vespilloides]|uniref:Set1/Ash2 histone methyltransferase complex subunit ASH2 isoform X1 n=1 Tax=Nicrophorus vespilloides TaxID=110193 RepID=A0ABM1MI83_NICVS|nr:PREDICTED: set1/Ash2 histone methyltransferase complex subunit ASH2 isoform X1 [Nicrophorus vespilloides]
MSTEDAKKAESELAVDKTNDNDLQEETKPTDSENDSSTKKKDTKNGKKTSESNGTCYCGKDRNLNIAELLCANCTKWFHESCIGYQLGKLVPFLSNYIFLCKNCSPTGLESFKKSQAHIAQMCVTAIANLQQNSVKDGTNRVQFSKDKEIIPYVEHHWEALTPRKVTQSWQSTVQRALLKDLNILFCTEESADGQFYGLINTDLNQIKPNYEAMIKGGTLRVTDMGIQHVPVSSGVKNRNTKRKFPGDVGGVGKKGRNADLNTPKLPSHGYPLDHPFNKDGYRYLLAEPDPHAPFRQEFDESSDWAGKPIPGWLYRTLVPSTVLLALHDSAPQLKISEDRLSVTGEKGYCTVRATHCISKGTWYWEATIDNMPEGSAARLGWGQDYANLQAPLGYDKFGYSWRSKKGTKFHESAGKKFSTGYGEGDTVGFLLILPEVVTTKRIPQTYKDRPLVKFKSHLYYEEKDNVSECLKKLSTVPGSKMMCFKNGELQGVAFEEIYGGSYYPTLSLHKSATVSVNFGPNFKFAPNTDIVYKAMNQKAEEAICEQTMADIIYLTENEGKLRLDNFVM